MIQQTVWIVKLNNSNILFTCCIIYNVMTEANYSYSRLYTQDVWVYEIWDKSLEFLL